MNPKYFTLATFFNPVTREEIASITRDPNWTDDEWLEEVYEAENAIYQLDGIECSTRFSN